MFKDRMILALVLGGLALVGCDRKKDAAPAATPSAEAPATPSASVPLPPPSASVPIPTPAVPATPLPPAAVVPSVTPTTEETPSVTPVVPPVTTIVPAPTTAPSVSGDVNADARATLAQFGKDMAAKDWKAASADLKTLSDEKDKLAPHLQDAVKKAQAELDIAKGAGRLKIPGFNGDDANK
jgi:hypothetical protein